MHSNSSWLKTTGCKAAKDSVVQWKPQEFIPFLFEDRKIKSKRQQKVHRPQMIWQMAIYKD